MCNKCGYKAPDGAYKCPRCGSPLSTRMDGGPGPRMGGQDQAEIPAWLETLRVGERPAATVSNSTNFSAADLIEDGSLPSWMRSGRPQASVSDAFNAVHPGSGSNPLMDQGPIPQKGLNAQSLVDENFLPVWMREGSSATPSTPSKPFEASSFVDSEALPDWMRSLQPPQSSPSGPQPVQPMPDATPDWMRSLQPPQSSTFSTQSAQSSLPTMSGPQPVVPPSTGFSARDLLDEQSLPAWMTKQSGAQPAVPSNGQSGSLSPASLVDQSALPNWMRENANSSSPVQSSPSRQTPVQPPVQAPVAQNTIGQNGAFAASSFVDPNSLPEWLRSGPGQPSAGMSAQPSQLEPSRSAAYSGPPRVENMRVPSRPRGEANANANDDSEVAANVFASMLGVASSAPQLPPSSPAQGPYGQQQPNPYSSPSQHVQQKPPANMPGQMPGYNGSGVPHQGPMPGYNGSGVPHQGPMPNTGMPGGYGGGYAGNPANRSPLGGPASSPMSSPLPHNGVASSKPSASAQDDDQKTSKKHGLVDTLLGWLLH